MEIFIRPARSIWMTLCSRPSEPDPAIIKKVRKILSSVRESGDEAVLGLTAQIDGRVPKALPVSEEDIRTACATVPQNVKEAISTAASNIKAFHVAQYPREISVETASGVRCIQRPVPIGRVGLYIPGGTAPLFSTVLMLAIPAKIAGCRDVVLCSPAGPDGEIAPSVLYAASFCGVDKIFRIGGAQAIAAMAYGTQSVPRVDKIFGPGNQWVTTAKQLVAGDVVSIDMPAGPSEVMVITDGESDAGFAAADLLSQAEHGRDSQVVLLCTTEDKVNAVCREVERQAALLSRKELAMGALSKSRFVVLDNEDDIVDFANLYAPEHLIISTSNPWCIADRITSAGSVFVGAYTPESAGDYASGTNHTLPTCAWARSCSGVNIDSFMRKMTLQEITPDGLAGLARTIVDMSEAEGLQAHANAVKIRIDE